MSVADVPAVCTTCGTAIPADRAQCPGCKRVFGEDNRCPHCHAIAAVKRVSAGYACVACNRPRELLPGTVVIEGDAPPPALRVPGAAPLRTKALGERAGAASLRLLGGASIGGSVLAAAATAATVHGVPGLVAAGVVGLTGVLAATFSFRAARRRSDRATDHEHAALELAVVGLAEKNDGSLTVTDVARAFAMGAAEADAILTRMAADGERVRVDVDDQGVVRYVFLELRPPNLSPRVRVEGVSETSPLEDDGAPSVETKKEGGEIRS